MDPPSTPDSPLMSSQAIEGDTAVAVSRSANTIIKGPGQLTRDEKRCLHDLLEKWAKMRPGNATAITLQRRTEFFDSVFDNWSSRDDYNPIPTIPDRKFTHTSIPVGTLIQDAPVTPKKRKRGEASQSIPARIKGAVVHLSVHLNVGEDNFGLLWRDARSATINPRMIQFDAGLNRDNAIRRAIIHWDKHEKIRVIGHNTELIIALARSRIVDFAAAGTAEFPVVGENLRIGDKIVKLELACDQIAKKRLGEDSTSLDHVVLAEVPKKFEAMADALQVELKLANDKVRLLNTEYHEGITGINKQEFERNLEILETHAIQCQVNLVILQSQENQFVDEYIDDMEAQFGQKKTDIGQRKACHLQKPRRKGSARHHRNCCCCRNLAADIACSTALAGDTNVREDRQPNTEIFAPGDLTLREKEALHDLLHAWLETRPSTDGNDQQLTLRGRNDFLNRAFHGWTSFTNFNPLPTLPDKKFAGIAISVGELTQDLPVALGKRKRGESQQQDEARVKGAKAFLSVHLNIGERDMGFLWRDKNSATVNQKYVRLDDGLTLDTASEKAIMHWDRREKDRICKFNTYLIIALAQNRIVDFARAGTAVGPRIKDSNGVQNRIVQVQLASDTPEEIIHNAYDAQLKADTSWCCVYGKSYPSSRVIAAHIVPYNTGEHNAQYLFDKSDKDGHIMSARNGIPMAKHIEEQFDDSRITLVPVPDSPDIKVVVLGASRPNATSSEKKLNGTILSFKNDFRLAHRYLYFHYATTLLRRQRHEVPGWWRGFSEYGTHRIWTTPGQYLRQSSLLTLARNVGHLGPEEAADFVSPKGIGKPDESTPEFEPEADEKRELALALTISIRSGNPFIRTRRGLN
ncbi:hypothetical protein FDECE_15216 [Fusarium decemcellulare]|nr:hypothetical protein FDECE_15216 [Fusarium decemcellulare]